ncbi:NADH dehydrogenase [ubiquinone] 1 beta subcomplex subunit 1 [Sphaerodactylus townsendi]|uniref:NADH dehydrogenase [ubiquinone] 1 beta subcomplex subunit 1 n=1 Tax=Sphaerodactylus townsendi TaxID=933632 RepID=UPI002026BAFD|nr:NADH dehydrogenase [ubiquinone] 1 beta subcomplex subunit 1 [Sphaerodactylus townsendi]XP_048341183.1 NADH dehydrogenase [ubiquinone] 1 beta subcomplex subunit 1 [Sphaerodactylus townsendi]
MVNVLNFIREYWGYSLVPLGFVVGWYFDKREDEKLSAFRNKSKLFQRELKPGEEVTWK